MNRFETFQQFLATQSVSISVWGFVLNLLLTALLAYALCHVYVKYGTSLSNRRAFANNFVLLSMTTMLIITIVKSSLALSLGLVGALSIVRFRAAIKEPEELAYLFLCIAIGLGFGADQRVITVVAFVIITAMIIWKRFFIKKENQQNYHLTIKSDASKKASLDQIVKILEKSCSSVNVRRFDETKGMLEASFLVEFENFHAVENCRTELQKLDDSIGITFLDNKGRIG